MSGSADVAEKLSPRRLSSRSSEPNLRHPGGRMRYEALAIDCYFFWVHADIRAPSTA